MMFQKKENVLTHAYFPTASWHAEPVALLEVDASTALVML
jgi:hypothetical protein